MNPDLELNAKSGLFAVVATVYLPASLATSFFGMNLKRLNDSGQSMGVFFVVFLGMIFLSAIGYYALNMYKRCDTLEWKLLTRRVKRSDESLPLREMV